MTIEDNPQTGFIRGGMQDALQLAADAREAKREAEREEASRARAWTEYDEDNDPDADDYLTEAKREDEAEWRAAYDEHWPNDDGRA